MSKGPAVEAMARLSAGDGSQGLGEVLGWLPMRDALAGMADFGPESRS